jgi:hypothetical protein
MSIKDCILTSLYDIYRMVSTLPLRPGAVNFDETAGGVPFTQKMRHGWEASLP